MNTITIIDPLNDIRWDRFVENHPFGWFCHLSGWKTVIEKSFPHMRGYYLVLFEDGGVNIKAALPLFLVKSCLIGNRLVSIPFASLCDPLVSSEKEMKRFLNPLLQLSEELSVSHTEIRTLSSCSLMPQNDFTVNWGFKNHFLDLTSDPENVKKHFHRTCVKQRIKRSQSHNLKLKIGRDQRELKTFYRLYAISRKQHGLPPQPYVFFKNMWDIFSPSGKLTLYLAVKDGNAIGGSILFKFKKRVSAEFMVMDKTYRSINPNHFLFWEAIKSACYEGYEIFDFGRTYHTNEPLMNFKKRWGTQTIDMPQFYFPARPTEKSGQKEDSMAYQFISNICRKAPDTVLQMLGFFCYRHLG